MANPLWQSIATAAGTPLSGEQLDRLDRYLDALIDWNTRLNLTRIVDRADAERKHIADALTLLKFLPPGRKRIADVGTGGGVPGVPVAIARPDCEITLIDSTKKKLDAIAHMISTVGVTNVKTLHSRIESAQATFDVIVNRAVSDMANLLTWCGPLMHAKSTMLSMKGPRAAEEIAAVPMKLRKQFKIEVLESGVSELPGHVIVRVRRI